MLRMMFTRFVRPINLTRSFSAESAPKKVNHLILEALVSKFIDGMVKVHLMFKNTQLIWLNVDLWS